MVEQSSGVTWRDIHGIPTAGFEPLRVTARVEGQIAIPRGSIALDSLLASQVAIRLRLPPPACAQDCVPIDIPIQIKNGVHQCSLGVAELYEHERRYNNRRPPIEKYTELGDSKGVVNIALGVEKQYRIPYSAGHVRNSTIEWFCIGSIGAVEFLLSSVHHLGKRIKVGLGRVSEWSVRRTSAWDGFPVLQAGLPLRPLPLNHPGLHPEHRQGFAVLNYPYWDDSREEICAIP